MPVIHRRPGIASVATLAGFTLTVGLVHLTAPEWSRAAGLDVWNATAERENLNAILAEGKQIDVRNEHIQEQIRGGWGIVARVASGQMTLREAVDEVDALNADRLAWADGLLACQPDVPTHRQRVARYIIAKVAFELRSDPSTCADMSNRLEAEYRSLSG